MYNKKGFVLVETIVVLAVLTVGLAVIYNSYTKVINASNASNTYDLSNDLYKVNAIKDLYTAKGISIETDHNVVTYKVGGTLTCYTGTITNPTPAVANDNCASTTTANIGSVLNEYYNALGVKEITIIKTNLLKSSTNTTLYFFKGSTIEYLKSIDLKSLTDGKKLMIVRFSDLANERIASMVF